MPPHPLDFVVEQQEDLLAWADLFEDDGLKKHALAIQVLYHENRWPSKYPGGTGVKWHPTRYHHRLSRHHLNLKAYAFYNPDQTCYARRYPTRTLAFLDLACHMAHAFTEESLLRRLTILLDRQGKPT